MNRPGALGIMFAIGTGVLLAMFTAPLTAHGGGLDSMGGHRDNKAGNYHAHRGNCAGRTFPSKDAAVAAACKR